MEQNTQKCIRCNEYLFFGDDTENDPDYENFISHKNCIPLNRFSDKKINQKQTKKDDISTLNHGLSLYKEQTNVQEKVKPKSKKTKCIMLFMTAFQY